MIVMELDDEDTEKLIEFTKLFVNHDFGVRIRAVARRWFVWYNSSAITHLLEACNSKNTLVQLKKSTKEFFDLGHIPTSQACNPWIAPMP